ncbi:hypothetical protein SAMN03159390_03708 [Pseudomonas sp. NFACC49-2]|uniref:hypothetical protein n=1 Tax=Pseudomonas sp. NFACC49-2 TaxID=1566222 RepID=UPI00091CCF1A|nr:hypothetical protein [Pseudomonas sp. NFACC49-2]SFY08208.1 hypothetical protein SAMN03159390_03708 [Pseudomonas sp. NFACC49-2]
MGNEKACVVFATGMDAEVKSVSEQLAEEGFDVCTAEADREIVEAAQSGSVPEEIKSCIDNAVICIFLIPEEGNECLTDAAGHAGTSGKRIVAVAQNVESLPQIFDDLASSVLIVDSPRLRDVILGEQIWERADGSLGPKRKIKRIECQ